MNKVSIIIPAALVPFMIVPLQHMHVSDTVSGLTIGALLALVSAWAHPQVALCG